MKNHVQEVHQQAKTQLHEKKFKSKERYDKTIQLLVTQVGEQLMIKENTCNGKLRPK